MKRYKNIEGNYYQELRKNRSQGFFYDSREDFLLSLFRPEKNQKVLDIGCGSGVISKKIEKKFGCNVTGIDVSEEAVKYCRESAKGNGRLEFYQGGIEKIPAKKESFDYMICSHVIEHCKNPKAALKECKRILKKGGKIILATPNYFSLWPVAEKVFDSFFAKKGYSLDEQHVSRMSFSHAKRLLLQEGFEIEKAGTLYLFSLPAALISKSLAYLLFEIDKVIFPLPASMITYIVASKHLEH